MKCVWSIRHSYRSKPSRCVLKTAELPKSAASTISALKRCSTTRDLDFGKRIHQLVHEHGHDSNIIVSNTLLEMYGRCGDMKLAAEVFHGMKRRSAITWTLLILGFVENGEVPVALELFSCMDCEPDHVTCLAAIKACACLASEEQSKKQTALFRAKSVHERVKKLALDSNLLVASALVDLYSRCGSMELARAVFDGMIDRDVVTWTSLILGYVNNDQSSVALDLFDAMDCQPNHFTYVAALKACAGLASESDSERHRMLETSMTMHGEIKARGYDSNVVLSNSLVEVYGRCRCMELARDVFDRMGSRTVATWNSLVLGYVENGESLVALEVFDSMDCEPNPVSYVGALKACAAMASERNLRERRVVLEKGLAIHKSVKLRGFDSNVVVASTLVDMYSKCGDMSLAREAFEKMARRNVIAWNSLILGYVNNGESSVALELVHNLDCQPTSVTLIVALKACAECEDLETGIVIHRKAKELELDSNVLVSNTLVDMYSKCRSMKLARDVFDAMPMKNVVAWSSLILGYVENEESSAAVNMFTSMDCKPNHVTFVAVLKACASLASLSLGRRIHGYVCRLGVEEEPCVATTLVDFYGRCGSMTNALQVFTGMNSPDVVSWSTLITVYSLQGNSSQVFRLAKETHEAGLRMNSISLVCVLTACSHLGLVKEAKTYFDSMQELGIKPSVEHYTCMVDILARAGMVEEAVAVINGMGAKADEATWTSLLGACRESQNLELAKAAFNSLVSNHKVHSAAPFVLMRDICMSETKG